MVGRPVGVLVGVDVGVFVGVFVTVDVAESVAIAVFVAVAVAVAVLVAVAVAVLVGVFVTVDVGVVVTHSSSSATLVVRVPDTPISISRTPIVMKYRRYGAPDMDHSTFRMEKQLQGTHEDALWNESA